jgi:hypothetical protein
MADQILINRLTSDDLNMELYNIVHEVREKYRLYGKNVKGDIYVVISDGVPETCNIRGAAIRKEANNEIQIERCYFKIVNYREFPEEFEFIIAHEFSHIYNDDYDKMMKAIGILLFSPFIAYVISSIIQNNIGISYSVAFTIIILEIRTYMRWRREMETRCDKDAIFITNCTRAAINAFKKRKKFGYEILSKLKGKYKIRRWFLDYFFYFFGGSHPTIPERIKNIQKWERELAKPNISFFFCHSFQ